MNIYQFMSESPVLTFFLVMGPMWGVVIHSAGMSDGANVTANILWK